MSESLRHFVRFRYLGHTAQGWLKNGEIHICQGNLFDTLTETDEVVPLAAVVLLPPCVPSKILCVGLNYASHVGDRLLPERPEIFVVPISARLAPGGTITIPPGTQACEFEGELVVVIGQTTKQVSEEQASEVIYGVTCGNDVSARDWQRNDLQWWRAKGCDTFAPFGPVLACDLDYSDLLLTSRLNGEIKQQQRTSDMIFSPAQIVSFISQHMTLYPGDVIYTGTPGATSPMKAGDVVEVEIEGIGVLRNAVG